jgi:hypothetical protein
MLVADFGSRNSSGRMRSRRIFHIAFSFVIDESEEETVGFRLAHVQTVVGRNDVVYRTDVSVGIVDVVLVTC